jgi:hypothetical protein
MKLVQEIIDLLSSDVPNLNNALFKTKVLMHRMGEKELIGWIDAELKGYSPADELPEYRVIEITVLGNISNRAYRYTEQPLPLRHLSEKLRTNLETTYLRQSIAVIEGYAKDDSNLAITIAPELYSKLSEAFGGGYSIERAWGKHSSGAMLQVVNEVRSRLLDFVLELSEKLPDEVNMEDMKEKSKEIGVSGMFKNAVFGPNATIVVGDHNVQNIKNEITTNDFDSLAQVLLSNRIQEDDIQALKEAIESDAGAPEHTNNNFGENVRNWFSTMMQKAADFTWDINVGMASSLLATALNSFYGWV